ncbi:MAG: hypothetical protein HY235_18500 [Acidobacteria bacterium]|nr:hypothetical protein [Acidobacteriota bacterium]
MKKLLAAVSAALGIWLIAQNVTTPKPLAELVPAGALLYLEAKNFNGLLSDWNASEEKKKWLAGDNYQVFSRSHLFLRLKQVFDEYAIATGVPPDLDLVGSVAGGESALAIYDINNLEFLYLTRMPSARAMESLLYKARERFASRNAAGTPYFLKTDAASKRTAAFAVSGDVLLIATREEALSGALSLLAGGSLTPVRREPWFEEASRAAAAPGDLRGVFNLEKLARAPSFRSYWIQRNVADLRQFTAGVNDLRRPSGELREERVLVRQDPAAAPDRSAVAGLLRLAANAGLYRAWAQPEPEFALDLLRRKILLPGPATGAFSKTAPQVTIEAALLGSEADLEARIDEPPFEAAGTVLRVDALRALLESNRPRAMLALESSRLAADRVFVATDAVVVVDGQAEWNLAQVRETLRHAVEALYTTAQLGLSWRERRAANESLWELDGLARLAVASRGRLLLISNRMEYLQSVLPLLNSTESAEAGSYVAGYRLRAEAPNYTRMMRLIEFPQGAGQPAGEPPFFSANLASLARSLDRMQAVSIVVQDDGRLVRQAVRYRLAP